MEAEDMVKLEQEGTGVLLGVRVLVTVRVGVRVEVEVLVTVDVIVFVTVGVRVCVIVGVCVGSINPPAAIENVPSEMSKLMYWDGVSASYPSRAIANSYPSA